MADSASGVTDNPVIAVQLHGEDEHDVRNISVVQDAASDNVPQNVPVSVSNADINIKLGDGRSLTFNTLLTFCVSAMSNALKMNVVQLIVMKFSENEVIAAIDVMCKNSDNMLQFQSRKESQYRSEKFVHSEDIYDGLKKLSDANKLPLFVTDGFGVSRLPKVDAEDITNVSIAEKIAAFERKFATFDESMTSILLKSLDNADRISSIEKLQVSQRGLQPQVQLHSAPVMSPSMYATIPTMSVACPADPGIHISRSERITTTSDVPTISTAGAELSISSHITNDVTSICQMNPPVSIVTSVSSAPSMPLVTVPNVNVSQPTNALAVSSNLTVSAAPYIPSSTVGVASTYSGALQTVPPQTTHGKQLNDKEQFPELPCQQQQLNVSCSASAPSTSGSDRQATNDGFKVANINRMARKMSTMRITGKATGCQLPAAPTPSDDVFASKFHRDTTDQELLDYLYSRNIMPKSVQVVSHEQSRTKSFKICCDRENFVKCFDENIWPDAIEIRKYNQPIRSGRLFDNTAI